jgi:multicomponent Na+:H+ antiporter subunit D
VLNGRVPETQLFELSPGIELVLRADAMGMVFALLASSLWLVVSVYSVGYMRSLQEASQTRFFTVFALSMTATIGVAFSANLLTFVLFYELLTLFTYPLVVHHETEEAVRAGRKYLFYTLSSGLALIGATAWVQILGIDATFRPGGFLSGLESDLQRWGLFALLIGGVGVKAAIMPLHGWLPSAMVAPAPVSALLHAVAVVKAGAFGVIRMVGFVFGVGLLQEMGAWQVLATAAGSTLIIGSVLALRHDNLKRRLAYSTISHLSYIALGVALLGPTAWIGAILHLVGHGVTKITLFMCAGAIHARTHRENVSEMTGIGRQMPITMGAFALAALSMAGIPPFVLFTSKWYLGLGAAEVGHQVFLILYMVSGVLTASYLFPVVFRAFWRSSPAFPRYAEASTAMVLPLAVTAGLALWLGTSPDFPFRFFELAEQISQSVTSPDSTTLAGGGP